MTQGRIPPALAQITLDSGITVGIRKVSPFTLDAVRRQYPAPRPPIVQNDYGDGVKRAEPNPADPDYQQALVDHQTLLSTKLMEAMLHLGVAVQVDAAALDAFKADMTALGVALEGDDRLLYIRHVVIATEDDLRALSEAITRKTMPTEEAVQEHLVTFSGDVPGPAADGDHAAPLGDQL